MIRKVVIPAAGLGTRLLSSTKELPKEMLPIFYKSSKNKISVKPLLQLIFEQLFSVGFREFCFIVGKEKRAIEDHFTPDYDFVSVLSSKKTSGANILKSFYKKLDKSSLIWVNQPSPLGFGDAVLRAKPFVNDEKFFVHAGDTLIMSKNNSHITRLLQHSINESSSILLQYVKDPKQYGVAKMEKKNGKFRITKVIEKPSTFISHWAIMPLYIFESNIFDTLKVVKPDRRNEIQLTDGIQKLIEQGSSIFGVPLNSQEKKLDIGTPEMYWNALNISHKFL